MKSATRDNTAASIPSDNVFNSLILFHRRHPSHHEPLDFPRLPFVFAVSRPASCILNWT